MDNLYTKGFSIRDIPQATYTLEEEEIFVSKKTWYCLVRKYCTAWEHHTYSPTDLRRVYRKTVLNLDRFVWLATVLLLVEIVLCALDCFHHYLGVVNANTFDFGHQTCLNTFHFDIASSTVATFNHRSVSTKCLKYHYYSLNCFVTLLDVHTSFDIWPACTCICTCTCMVYRRLNSIAKDSYGKLLISMLWSHPLNWNTMYVFSNPLC